MLFKSLRQSDYLKQYEEKARQYIENSEYKLNYFAFESQVRRKLLDLIHPISEQSGKDRQEMAKIKSVFENLDDRICDIEGVLKVGKGKNVMYDRLMEICNNSEVERIQFTQVCKQQIERMSDALEKIELKIVEHSLNIEAQDKMHSSIFKRVTDMYASQE